MVSDVKLPRMASAGETLRRHGVNHGMSNTLQLNEGTCPLPAKIDTPGILATLMKYGEKKKIVPQHC